MAHTDAVQINQRTWGFCGQFRAMASPCELLIADNNPETAQQIMKLATTECWRIEQKFSRFIKGNLLWQINHSDGREILLDTEMFQLLEFARQCYQLSEGKFDISAEPLMQLWRFDGSDSVPKADDITKALAWVGFNKIHYTKQKIRLPKGMSLDFGGIGKEYAVDRVAALIATHWPDTPVLVNLGGDIACPIARDDPWQVGIENPRALDNAAAILNIKQGALATSGDTRRYIECDGKRYGHIIDPSVGYPVKHAPRSVTVLSNHCVAAGMLATMAMLKGALAEDFLRSQQVEFQVFRQE